MFMSVIFQSRLSKDPLDLIIAEVDKRHMVTTYYAPDTVEALDADSVLLDGGVAHGDPPAEDLGDVPHPHVPHVPR